MKVIVTSKQRLDELVFTHYGSLKNLELVIQENPHLNEKLFLEAGDEVQLSEAEVPTKEKTTPALWD